MLPPATDQRWTKLVKGEVSHTYKFLALKIALTRMQNKVKFNEAPLGDVVKEAVEFFTKNEKLLTDDIKTIFG